VVPGSFDQEILNEGIDIYSYPSCSQNLMMWEHQVNWFLSQNLWTTLEITVRHIPQGLIHIEWENRRNEECISRFCWRDQHRYVLRWSNQPTIFSEKKLWVTLLSKPCPWKWGRDERISLKPMQSQERIGVEFSVIHGFNLWHYFSW
jgi:hypothetical protein